MKILTDRTLIIVMESFENNNSDRPAYILNKIKRVIPDCIRNSVELSVEDGQIVLITDNSPDVTGAFASSIYEYLKLVCVEEQCNAFDERYLISLLNEFSSESYLELCYELNNRIQKHIDYANTKFDGDLNFHRRADKFEVVTTFSDYTLN